MASPVGTVYLLHFDRRYHHAGHYLGWTTDLNARLVEHACGRGARLMAVIQTAGIGFRLARTWSGTRARERQIKRQGGLSRCCPDCGVTPRHGRWSLMAARITAEQVTAAYVVLDVVEELVRVQLASRALTDAGANANAAQYLAALSDYDRAASQLRDVVGDRVDDCDIDGLSELCVWLVEAGDR
jgi:predicted GIY-YIG superfamily endonuclease